MKKIYLMVLFLVSLIDLHAVDDENTYSFSLSTSSRETTFAESVISDETELYLSLEAFFPITALTAGDLAQGPILTIFDVTNEDDSYSDYFYAGWQWAWEFRSNLQLIGSLYAVFDRAFYKNNDNNQQLTITLRDGYGAKLALRVEILEDFGVDIASGVVEVDESGDRTYTYEETSISLVWWF